MLHLILATMDYLWTPWRYRYVTGTEEASRKGVPAVLAAWTGDLGCVFCNLIAATDFAVHSGMSADQAESEAYIVHRGHECFVCLNAFPYTSGHVMVIPYAHQASLADLPVSSAHEMSDLAQKIERALRLIYRPHGINLGMNLGEAAGAGVAGHLHLHVLPRWTGDTNFMTTIAETRILPEDMATTCNRIRRALSDGFQAADSD